MPEAVALMYYLPRNTFADKSSEEERTGITKKKYKLLFKQHKELGLYVFFVLNSSPSACVKERMFSIEKTDWEERLADSLDADCSYTDVQSHSVVHNKIEVLEKANNPKIGFSYVAKLHQSKFNELFTAVENYLSATTVKTDLEKRELLKSIVIDDKATDFINKFKV